MLDRQVDEIACSSDLRNDFDPLLLQPVSYQLLELGIGLTSTGCSGVEFAGLGVFQICLERTRAKLGSLVCSDVARPHGSEDFDAVLRAREQYVQAPMSVFSVYGTKPVHYHTGYSVRAVGGRNEYDVALVALHILKVLHKERFECVFPTLDILLCRSLARHETLQLFEQHITLGLVQRN